MRIAVLMPAFDEGDRLARTLQDLAAQALAGPHRVTLFVVDDGSRVPIDPGLAPAGLRVVLARHPVNLGQGAALETARRLALDPRWQESAGHTFDAWVTMDADGQHRAEDAMALARTIAEGADVALGDRFAGASDVPRSRRWLLRLARLFERWATGLELSDAHNGLRAFSARAIAEMRLRQNRMAHATELTRRISTESRRALASPLRIVEVPVRVRYTDETLRKGQSASGAIAILVDLFQGFLFAEPPARGPRTDDRR